MGTSSSTLGLIASVRSLGDPNVPVTLDSHDLWRGLFTASFTVVDLDTVVTGQYVRTLRMRQPERLAALLYKCITQLHAFASSQCCYTNTPTPIVGSTAAERGGMPPTQSVVNALMIIGRVLPFVFEDLDDVVKRTMPTAQQPSNTTSGSGHDDAANVSPMAKEFLKAFFLHNRTCCLDPAAPHVFPELEGGQQAAARSMDHRYGEAAVGDDGAVPRPAYPLGQCLVDCLVQLCFVSNFTIPATVATAGMFSETAVIMPELLWFKGVGGVVAAGDDASALLPGSGPSSTLLGHLSDAFFASMANNRRLILHTLLVVLSAPLHHRQCIVEDPIFAGPLTQNNTTMLFPTLVASMLNAVVSYNPRGRLPYTSHLITAAEHVVVLSAQVLCVVLDYAALLLLAPAPNTVATTATALPQSAPPREEDGDESIVGTFQLSVGAEDECNADDGGVRKSATTQASQQQELQQQQQQRHASNASAAPSSQRQQPTTTATTTIDAALCRNQAWRVMCSMTEREARWVIEGLAPLFSNVTFAKSTYLPQSQRQIFESDQLIIMVWKLLDRCEVLRSAFGTTPAALSYVVPLCFYLLKARDDAKKFSVAQIAMFVLLKLSASRDFIVLCNEPFAEYIPFTISEFAHGTYNDLIAMSMMAVLQAKTDAANTLQTSCATVLANMAPYMTSIALGTSQRLVWQLESFGRVSYLLDNPPRNGKLLMLVVEAVASLLQYQYRGCGHLAYTLVRTRDALRAMLNIFSEEKEDEELEGGDAATTADATKGAAAVPVGHKNIRTSHRMALAELTAPGENAKEVEAFRRRLLLTLSCAIERLEALIVPVVKSMELIDIPTHIANKTTLVGSLPVPHNIVVRRYGCTFDVDEWVSKVMWGFIFSHSVPGTIIAPSSVRLFGFA